MPWSWFLFAILHQGDQGWCRSVRAWTIVHQRVRKRSENPEGVLKGLRSQLKRTASGQMWDMVNIKTVIVMNSIPYHKITHGAY